MRRLRRAIALLREILRQTDEKNLGLIAAGVAFYAILAVFPGLGAVIALWGVVGDPGLAVSEVQEYLGLIPDDVEALILGQIKALAEADGLTLGWASILSLLLAIWSARAGVAAIMRGLNAIYGVPNRQGFSHYVRALVLTIALIGVALTALVCVVVVPVAMAFFPLGLPGLIGLEALRWVIAIGVLLAGFSLIYWLGPNARIRHLPGAMLATVLWAAASVGFSVYLSNFFAYNEVYGSIGAVIALLMWLFISAWLVLLGGALNVWLSEQQQPEPDRADAEGG